MHLTVPSEPFKAFFNKYFEDNVEGNITVNTVPFPLYILLDMKEIINERVLSKCVSFSKKDIHNTLCVTTFFMWVDGIVDKEDRNIQLSFYIDYDEFAVDITERDCDSFKTVDSIDCTYLSYLSREVITQIVNYLIEINIDVYIGVETNTFVRKILTLI